MKGARPLSDKGKTMLRALEEANGQFVSGKDLAEPLGISTSGLNSVVRHITTMRPDVVIQGQHGRGYRLVIDGVIEPQMPRSAPAAPKHVSYRATLDLLAALLPATAEKVREVALESGQSAERAIERLIDYGVEVHRDLVRHGENPLMLERVA